MVVLNLSTSPIPQARLAEDEDVCTLAGQNLVQFVQQHRRQLEKAERKPMLSPDAELLRQAASGGPLPPGFFLNLEGQDSEADEVFVPPPVPFEDIQPRPAPLVVSVDGQDPFSNSRLVMYAYFSLALDSA
jgi:hypothetical protein